MSKEDALFLGTGPVREAHQFDEKGLQAYLHDQLGYRAEPMVVRQYDGGQSNPTYLVIAGREHFVLRRKPPGTLLPSAHAVEREYRILSTLHSTGVPVPRAVALCEDPAQIGSVFYLMEHVPGRIFRDPALPGLSPNERGSIYEAMNEAIAQLHSVDYAALGLADFGRPDRYIERQIERWSKQYRASITEPIEAMDHLMEWLPKHVPSDDETTIVHGDFRLENLVIHPDRPAIAAILDWELSTLGHPLADFAYHCLVFRFPRAIMNGLRDLDLSGLGIPSESAYVALYRARTKRPEIPHFEFYLAYNMFRGAAIFQGVAKRAAEGNAASARAAALGALAAPTAELAWKMIQTAS